jgi:hypothetical protein
MANKLKVYELPRYSRVRMEGLEVNGKLNEEFNFLYMDGTLSLCITDSGLEFNLYATQEVELLMSMKEHEKIK